MDQLNGSDLKQAFLAIQKMTKARQAFWDTLDRKLEQAAAMGFQAGLAACSSLRSRVSQKACRAFVIFWIARNACLRSLPLS